MELSVQEREEQFVLIRLVGQIDPAMVTIGDGASGLKQGVVYVLMDHSHEFVSQPDALSFGHVVESGWETVAKYAPAWGVVAEELGASLDRISAANAVLYPKKRFVPRITEHIPDGEEVSSVPPSANLLHTTESGETLWQHKDEYYVVYPAWECFAELVEKLTGDSDSIEKAVRAAIAHDKHLRTARAEKDAILSDLPRLCDIARRVYETSDS